MVGTSGSLVEPGFDRCVSTAAIGTAYLVSG